MKFRFEKLTRIISELLTYCHQLGAVDYDAHMDTQDGVVHIHICCTIPTFISERTLKELETELNRTRQHEIEQNYWGLSGDMEPGNELTLVGMMVDKAIVTRDGDKLSIRCLRVED